MAGPGEGRTMRSERSDVRAAEARRGDSQDSQRREKGWTPGPGESTGQIALDVRSAAEIRQLLHGLGRALDALGIGAFVVDAAGQLVFVNDSAARLLRKRTVVMLRDGRLRTAESR